MPKVLDIRKYSNPVLREVAEEVVEITPEIRTLIANMKATMEHHNGLGLAAPQVGVSKKIIVFRTDNSGIEALINPIINDITTPETAKEPNTNACGSGTMSMSTESCLSIPGFSGQIIRSTWIDVHGMDENWSKRRYLTAMTVAYTLQHEIDHLNGILFVDRLLNRKAKRTWDKFARGRGWK